MPNLASCNFLDGQSYHKAFMMNVESSIFAEFDRCSRIAVLDGAAMIGSDDRLSTRSNTVGGTRTVSKSL